ncbi:MAG: sulfotransferase family protein [Bacteroidota bacterium]
MRVISLWSGPRNVSTAFMYSFAQRKDFEVVDEPLYGYYLSLTDIDHPGKDEILATMNTDGESVLKAMLTPSNKPFRLLKNMAHHWVDLDMELLNQFTNIFLIRNPAEMLPSLVKQIPDPVLRDTGLERQYALFEHLKSRGEPVAVVDSKQLLLNPADLLKKLCKYLGISFDEQMLSWTSGALPEDGVWAKYWYHNVHNSSGFQPYRSKKETFPESLKPLLHECEPYYKLLLNHSIKL